MTEKLFWQNDEKKPVVCFRARSGPRADNRSWFVTTIPAGVQLQKASSKYFNMSVGFLTL
jgi:hypothetical protein